LSSVVRSVLILHARQGRRDDVVALFARLGVLREASVVPGFVDAELHVADGDELLVTATWESAAAYDGWLESPVRERMRPELEELLVEPPVPRVYELVHRATASD
jgi:heme-degrading monooxygenase HmoA